MLSSRPDNDTLRLIKTLFLLIVVAFHGLLASCNPVESRLRVATTPWPGYETLHLAYQLGKL